MVVTRKNFVKRPLKFGNRRRLIIYEVAASFFYSWLTRPDSPLPKEENRLVAEIKTAYKRTRKTYGMVGVKLGHKSPLQVLEIQGFAMI